MPGRILVVDDSASARCAIRATLSAAYYDVIEAESGVEALRLAASEEPDLVLLDLVMPGIDGFETCRRLKSAAVTAHVPIVILSARSDRADRVRGLDCGADDVLAKPFDDVALLARVSSLTRMKMMIDELRLRAETSRELGLEPAGPLDTEPDFAAATVLLVTADLALATATRHALRAHLGLATEIARGALELRALLVSNVYDAFVIGPELADGEPMRLASMLRGRPSTRQAALMMLFRAEDREGPPLALEMGVPDYLRLPPDHAEMAARLRVQLRRKHYSDQLRRALADSMVKAVTDPLTGLYNRRYCNAHLETMIAQPRGAAKTLAAMVLDLDRFKTVNDRHGHGAGDAVLVEFARRLKDCVRGVDLVSRIGGEEFLVVMPDILPEHASRVAERVRHAVEHPGFAVVGADGTGVVLDLTVSIGLALHQPGETPAALIARADTALYASKSAGRNMVTLAAA